MEKAFLIEFQYDHWCQGWDRNVWTSVLVFATDFLAACEKIEASGQYENSHGYKNKTIL